MPTKNFPYFTGKSRLSAPGQWCALQSMCSQILIAWALKEACKPRRCFCRCEWSCQTRITVPRGFHKRAKRNARTPEKSISSSSAASFQKQNQSASVRPIVGTAIGSSVVFLTAVMDVLWTTVESSKKYLSDKSHVCRLAMSLQRHLP